MGRERNESHDAGALNRFADDALVFHASAALATREDFAGGRGESLQATNIFVVKFINGVRAQVAGAFFDRRVLWFLAHEGSWLAR